MATSSPTNGEGHASWAQPPSEPPPPISQADEAPPTMVLVPRRALQPVPGGKEVTRLAFSPGDDLIVGMAVPAVVPYLLKLNMASPPSVDYRNKPTRGTSKDTKLIYAWRARPSPGDDKPDDYFKNDSELPAQDFAFLPTPGLLHTKLATSFNAIENTGGFDSMEFQTAQVDIHVLPPQVKAKMRQSLQHRKHVVLTSPIALSPSGDLLAGVAHADPKRVMIASNRSNAINPQTGLADDFIVTLATPMRVLPNFGGEVTHLAFTTLEGQLVLATAARDGVLRLTNVDNGRTLRRFETRGAMAQGDGGFVQAASLLRASPDGKLIASIWGREVMLWYPGTGEVRAYSLNVSRRVEGWPLEISQDCKYLLCRTESGFDVSELESGRFLGESPASGKNGFVTAAAFSWDGKQMAAGRYTGEVYVYDVLVTHGSE